MYLPFWLGRLIEKSKKIGWNWRSPGACTGVTGTAWKRIIQVSETGSREVLPSPPPAASGYPLPMYSLRGCMCVLIWYRTLPLTALVLLSTDFFSICASFAVPEPVVTFVIMLRDNRSARWRWYRSMHRQVSLTGACPIISSLGNGPVPCER